MYWKKGKKTECMCKKSMHNFILEIEIFDHKRDKKKQLFFLNGCSYKENFTCSTTDMCNTFQKI